MASAEDQSVRGIRDTLVLCGVIFGFGIIRYLRYHPAYSGDAIYYLAYAENVAADPSRLFALDYAGRAHPLFFALLAVIQRFANLNPTPLLVAVYVGHLFAADQLRRLTQSLGASAGNALGGALLFAVFSGANNLFADPIHFARTLNLGIALAALNALLRGRPGIYLLLYFTTLTNFEDALLLPLAAVALSWLQSPRNLRCDRAFHALAAAIAISFVLIFAGGASFSPTRDPVAFALRAVMLPIEIARSTLIARSDVVQSLAPRVLVGAVLAALCLWGAARTRAHFRVALALLWLTLAFALPYLGRDTGGTWPSRYLYMPAAPVLAMAGVAFSALPALARTLAFATIAAIGLANTERAAEVITARHLHALTADSLDAIVTGTAAALRGTPTVLRLSPNDCAFVMRDLVERTHVPLKCQPIDPDNAAGVD